MAKFLIYVALSLMAVAAFAVPVKEPELEFLAEVPVFSSQVVEALAAGVDPRITCDVISGLGVAHSVCAVHCIFKGYKEGRCERGVCNCRR